MARSRFNHLFAFLLTLSHREFTVLVGIISIKLILIWNKGNNINILWEKKERLVVLADSELYNTHYYGVDDTPTQETYHTPNTNKFNCNPHKYESKLKRDSMVKVDGIHFEATKLNWSWESYLILNIMELMILQHKSHTVSRIECYFKR